MQVKFIWNEATRKKLNEIDETITYEVARRVLDTSLNTIPRKTGALRSNTMANGVQKVDNGYQLVSDTKYANKLYKLNTNNWTTPGTNNQWFHRTWREKGSSIFKEVVERNILK